MDHSLLPALLTLELAVSSALCGFIWLIQIVHYPLFSAVGSERFASYESAHCRRITFVVAPLMLAELLLASIHFLISGPDLPALIGAVLIAALWFTTFFVHVPLHNRLRHEFCAATHRALVRMNWIRTIAWTGRTILLTILNIAAPFQ